MNIIGYSLLGVAILLLFFIPVLYSGFAFGNTDYSFFVSYKIFVALLFTLLMLVSLGTYCIIKKRFLLHFVGAFSALSLALSFGFLGFTQTHNNHIFEGIHTQSYTLESFTGTTLTLYEQGIDFYGNTYVSPAVYDGHMIEFEKARDEYFMIEIENHIFSDSPASTQHIGEKLSDFQVSEIRGVLDISLPNNQIFREQTNFTPLYRVIKVHIPEGKELNTTALGYSPFTPYCDGVFVSQTDIPFPLCKTAQILEAENAIEVMLEDTFVE